MKRYIILAGVNGAGKSTLFSLVPYFNDVNKINLDETVRETGSWRNADDVIKAGKTIVERIRTYFNNGESFSQETTLCGKGILRNIETAKQLGYFVELHYIGLDNVEIAKERVKNRELNGGHGVLDKDIERRYIESFENLKKIIPFCDLIGLYDNTESIKLFAIYINGKTERVSDDVPEWYKRLLLEH